MVVALGYVDRFRYFEPFDHVRDGVAVTDDKRIGSGCAQLRDENTALSFVFVRRLPTQLLVRRLFRRRFRCGRG